MEYNASRNGVADHVNRKKPENQEECDPDPE